MPAAPLYPPTEPDDEQDAFLLPSGTSRGLVAELVDAMMRVREKDLLLPRCQGWSVRERAAVVEENAVAVRCELSQGARRVLLQWRLHVSFGGAAPAICLSLESRRASVVVFSKPQRYFNSASPVGHLVSCLDFLTNEVAAKFVAAELAQP